jgi:Xaa-Pro dipeptidase
LADEPVMVLRRLDVAPFLERSWLDRYVGFIDWEDPVAIAARVIDELGCSRVRIGIDGDSYCMTVRRHQALRAALPQVSFVEFSGVLRELRLIKSPDELGYIRRAAAVADGAMQAATAAAGVGVSERAVAAAASEAFVRLGADHGRVGPITRAGRGWGFLHGHLRDQPLQSGDVLHLELVPIVQGYSARLMRPAVIGAATEEQRKDAALLVAVQDRQIAAMRPGAIGREVDAICRTGLIESGLRDSYDNPTGYTLGYYHFSTPRTSDFTRVFNPRADWRLEAGMVFHMYASARGMAFSETVLVTASGPERLTQLERKIVQR